MKDVKVKYAWYRHPEVQHESVPELKLPILKAERNFFCQYCDKVTFIFQYVRLIKRIRKVNFLAFFVSRRTN